MVTNEFIETSSPDFVHRPANPAAQQQHACADIPLDVFFASFPHLGFVFNPYARLSDEYARLCEALGFDIRAQRKNQHRPQAVKKADRRYKRALVKQFEMLFGTDASSLDAWHRLCDALSIAPLPRSLEECSKVMGGVYVNIIDLLDAVRVRGLGVKYMVPAFHSELELSEYTKLLRRFFPLRAAEREGLLGALLRHILTPRKPENMPAPHASMRMEMRKTLNKVIVSATQRYNKRKLAAAIAANARGKVNM